ncbi:MAG: LysR family transcriptional regulator, partial [Oscillospiraceae bacterium]
MPKFDLYSVFYEVAETGSFSKAAKNLFVTQSAVSQSIKRLESELNVTLF